MGVELCVPTSRHGQLGKTSCHNLAAEFLLRDSESREFLGLWINSSNVHEAKKRRAKQVITRSIPCGKWLHMIGARASPGCELCKRERNMDLKQTDVLPTETVAHIQSAGCKSKKKIVIGAHNRCWKYLIGVVSTVNQQETLNLLEGIKTSFWKSCGQKQRLETFCHGMKLRTRRQGFLRVTRPIDKFQMMTR
jgi:hypothetical protein